MNECKKEKRGGICFYNCDNIEFMKTKPDNYYDLAIVDPPYGIGADKEKFTPINKTWIGKKKVGYLKKDWDKEIPTPEYFEQLFRVSKKRIFQFLNSYQYILLVAIRTTFFLSFAHFLSTLFNDFFVRSYHHKRAVIFSPFCNLAIADIRLNASIFASVIH
jgi:DNA modification methylase